MKKYLIQIVLFLLLATPWACVGAAALLYCDDFALGCGVATMCVAFGALCVEAVRK